MGIEFVKLLPGQCVLCGETAAGTGEHKVKASIIKSEFGDVPITFVGKDGPKLAQSSKSKHFHFHSAPLCKECNSARNQPGDRAFDLLHAGLKHLYDSGRELTIADHRPKLPFGK